MSELARNNIVKTDLSNPLQRQNVGVVLAAGDEKANRFGAEIYRDGQPVDISDCIVLGYFVRPNDNTVLIQGVAEGNTAYVDLSQNCYKYDGAFSLTVKISNSSEGTQTVYICDGHIVPTRTDTIVDDERLIPSVEEIAASMEEVGAATASANDATEKANASATSADTAAANAETATRAATSAAAAANAAAGRAPYIGDNGNWFAWDTAHGVYADTGIQAQGEQGAPGTGLEILGTFASVDALRAAVTNPEQGDMYNVGTTAPYSIYMWQSSSGDWEYQGELQGANGETGPHFTPSVDADGNLSWTNNGGLANPETVNIKGDPGDPGEPGKDGNDGDDGYTPVKGTDYWTETDKAEMVNDVLAALTTWNGGDY